MAVTINASTTTGLVQSADTSGTVEIQSNGTTRLTVASGGVTTTGNTSIANLTATGTFGGGVITSGTSVASTSGTSIDFTSIPSWVKRITVMFNGVSTNGTSNVLVQLGTSGGPTTSGYAVEGVTFNSNSPNTGIEYTTGFPTEVFNNYVTAAGLRSGSLVFNTLGSNIWVGTGIIGVSWASGPSSSFVGGKIALAAALDRVRITTVNGTDTFDAGSINILYEG